MSLPYLTKLVRQLIEDIRKGRMDADEAASVLAETFTGASVSGYIAGGLLPRGNKWDREGTAKVGGAHKDAFPTGTRDPRTGVPNTPPWGSGAEQKTAKNLPGRKRMRESTETATPAEEDSFAYGYHKEALGYLRAYFPKDGSGDLAVPLRNGVAMKAHLHTHEKYLPLVKAAANAHGKGFSPEAFRAGREAHRDRYVTVPKYRETLTKVMDKVMTHAGYPAG
jgi:hypothetical protein